MVAQGAHASLCAIFNDSLMSEETLSIKLTLPLKAWLTGNYKKICVSIDSEEQLLTLYHKAKDSGLMCALVKDSGLTEFKGVPQYTAICIGPEEESKIDPLTSHLSLL